MVWNLRFCIELFIILITGSQSFDFEFVIENLIHETLYGRYRIILVRMTLKRSVTPKFRFSVPCMQFGGHLERLKNLLYTGKPGHNFAKSLPDASKLSMSAVFGGEKQATHFTLKLEIFVPWWRYLNVGDIVYISFFVKVFFVFRWRARTRSSLLTEMESQQALMIMAPITNQEETRDIYRKWALIGYVLTNFLLRRFAPFRNNSSMQAWMS